MIKKEESRPVCFIRQNQPKNSLGIFMFILLYCDVIYLFICWTKHTRRRHTAQAPVWDHGAICRCVVCCHTVFCRLLVQRQPARQCQQGLNLPCRIGVKQKYRQGTRRWHTPQALPGRCRYHLVQRLLYVCPTLVQPSLHCLSPCRLQGDGRQSNLRQIIRPGTPGCCCRCLV